MEITALESPAELYGAIESHGRAWRAAYQDILSRSVLSSVPIEATDEMVQDWFDRIGTDSETFLVASDDEEASRGYIYVRWGEETKAFVGNNEAGLKEIYVHPDWWGEGIGTRLLDEAIAALPSNIEAIRLEMLAGNEIGDTFYQARGFERIDRDEVEIGERSYPTDIYTRVL